MEQNKIVPAIRFKGFENKWVNKKLGDIGKTFTGLSGKTKEDFGHGEGKFVTYMNVFSNPISDPMKLEKVTLDKNQTELQYGDVLFTTSSETPEEVGMSSIWLYNFENIYLNSFCFGYRQFIDMNKLFLAYSLRSKSFRSKMIPLAQGISRYNISKGKVMDLYIPLPNLLEQTQIGNFFKNLDDQISLQEQKHQKLLNLKKAMLEKMFTKEGADMPEIRFKGFTEKWEYKKLNYYIKGLIGGVSITPSDYTNEGIRTIPKGAINEFGVANLNDCKYVSYSYAEKFKNNQVKTNEIVTSLRDLVPSAPNLGRIVKVLGKEEFFLMPQGVYRLMLNKNIDESFLIILSNTDIFREIIFANKSGSTQVHMRNQEFLNIVMKFPSLEEQQKIGEYFENLDNLIQNSQTLLSKHKNIKQALLQKMFV